MDKDEVDFLLSLPKPPEAKNEAEDALKPRWCGVRGLDGSVE